MSDPTSAEYGFDTPKPPTLVLAIRDGHARIKAADVATVTVHVSGPRAEDARVEQRGDRIMVVGPRPRGFFAPTDLDYEIVAPTETQLVVQSAAAAVDADGRFSSVRVKASTGPVTIDDITGSCVVDTGTAAIRVGAVGQGLRVRTGSGRVDVGAVTRAAISTGSGDVRVDRLGGRLVVKTGSGDLEVGEVQGDVVFTSGSGDIVVRRSRGGRITAKGAGGDVSIGVAEGIAVWTDVSTYTGSIRSDLPRTGEPEQGAPYVEVRATTASGDITLTSA